MAVLVLLCIKNKDNIKGAITVGIILATALMSSLHTYFYEYNYARQISDLCRGETHTFSCRVISEEAETDGLFFVSISHIDTKALKREIKASCYNSSGNYFNNGTFLNVTGTIELTDPDKSAYSGWLNGKGIYTEIRGIEDIVPVTSKNIDDASSMVKGFFEKRMFEVMKNVSEKPRFERAFSLSNAMMFGDKGSLDGTLINNFRKSGLIHILCVSGLHFSVILGGFSVLLRLVVKPRRLRNIILILTAVFYICLCGFARSAIRAAVMSLASALGLSSAKSNSCTYNLLFAAGVICIFDPKAVMDSGFIMSCICCTGIICSSYILESICNRFKKRIILSFILSSFAVSFGASVFLIPYTLSAFGGVSVVSVLASSVAVLPAQILLMLCWLASILSGLGIEVVNFVFAGSITFLSDLVCGVAEFFASLRYSYIEADIPDISFLIFMITLTVAAFVTNSKSRAASVYLYIAPATAVAAAIFVTLV